MILGTDRIRQRIKEGGIFRTGTSEDSSIKEASYALRVDNDRLIIGGETFEPGGKTYTDPLIKIDPGRIAILSTVERLRMPHDLVGRLGIRLDFASRGLTGLMGIQVDPYYGQTQGGEQLFIRVANFGNETIEVPPRTPVFNIEFSEVKGAAPPNPPKSPTWERLKENLAGQEHSDWTLVARVQSDLDKNTEELTKQLSNDLDSNRKDQNRELARIREDQDRELDGIRNNQQSVVMFGVFLVAVTILGAMVALILNVREAPNWVSSGGWIALLALLFIAVGALVWFVSIAGWKFLQPSRNDNEKPR